MMYRAVRDSSIAVTAVLWLAVGCSSGSQVDNNAEPREQGGAEEETPLVDVTVMTDPSEDVRPNIPAIAIGGRLLESHNTDREKRYTVRTVTRKIDGSPYGGVEIRREPAPIEAETSAFVIVCRRVNEGLDMRVNAEVLFELRSDSGGEVVIVDGNKTRQGRNNVFPSGSYRFTISTKGVSENPG